MDGIIRDARLSGLALDLNESPIDLKVSLRNGTGELV